MKVFIIVLCLYSSMSIAREPVHYNENKDWLLANVEKVATLREKMISDPVVETIFVVGGMGSFKGRNASGFLAYVEPEDTDGYDSLLGAGNAFYSALDGQFSISIGGQKECYGRHCDVEIIYTESASPYEKCDVKIMRKEQTICSVHLLGDWHLRYMIYTGAPAKAG